MFDYKPTQPAFSFPTLQANLHNGVYNKRWSETRIQKIKGSVNKAPKVFKAIAGIVDPAEIPTDRAEIDFHIGPWLERGKVPPGSAFKTTKSMYTWWSNYGSFCDVATGRRDAETAIALVLDDWSELLAHIDGKRSAPALLGTREGLPISTLARECRIRGLSIKDLSSTVVTELVESVSTKTARRLLKAAALIDRFIIDECVPPELLPDMPIGKIEGASEPKGRIVPSLNPEYERLLYRYIDVEARGHRETLFGSVSRIIKTRKVSDARAKNIRIALRWFWHGLTLLGHVRCDGPFDCATLVKPVNLPDVVEACAAGKLGPVCDPQTRRDMVMIVIAFLDWLQPGYRGSIDSKFFKSIDLRRQKDSETEMQVHLRTTCLGFIRDEAEQRVFFGMPRHFFDEAREQIARFDQLFRSDGNGVSKDQHLALDLATLAALTAINTNFPLRLATLMQLTIKGRKAQVLFPKTAGSENTVILDVPGTIMKNGRSATGVTLFPNGTVDPREILEWYIKEAHPLVLKYKVKYLHHRRPDLLFAGLNIEAVRNIWNRRTKELGLDMTVHMARHLLASLLYHHGVPIEDIAELLCDSVPTVIQRYTFVDRQKKIQDVMAAKAEIFGNLEE